jgi:ABC-2 type transport system permease protein
LWASLRGQLAYRGSFLLEVIGRGWLTGLELVAVVVLIDQARDLAGFGRYEVVYLYGVASMALGVAELLTDGISEMPVLVRTGALDGILVRPAPALVQVLALECRPLHFGRILQGAVAVVWALLALEWDPGPIEVGMLALNGLGPLLVFVGIFVAEGATCVFTVQSTELFNAFSYGGLEMGRYPVPIYRRWLRSLFLWVVPVGLTGYAPALVVLGRPDPLGLPGWVPYAAPLVGALFLAACLRYWSFAIDRYRGTGS